jgi:hypothetical protein
VTDDELYRRLHTVRSQFRHNLPLMTLAELLERQLENNEQSEARATGEAIKLLQRECWRRVYG